MDNRSLNGSNRKNGKRPVGRPPGHGIRSPENADKICAALAHGFSLVSICETPGLPSYAAVMAWLQEDEVFVAKYARARKLAAAFNEHRAVEIALRATPENVQVAKLQFDALKWQMSKQDPKVYGDKPGDVHVTTAVNNFVVMSEERQRQLQERHAVALKGR